MPVLGVDACRSGWVGVLLDDAGFAGAVLAPRLADLVAAAGPVDVVGVDMPIGTVPAGVRAADRAARQVLGPRRSSVFLAPPAAALEVDDYATANARCRAATGMGLSRQAWNLVPKVREVAAFRPDAPAPVHEVHPEVSFRAMAGGPLASAKATWAGFTTRVGLLRDHGVDVPHDLGAAGAAGVDDVLDAAAAAWSARRVAAGLAATLPDPPEAGDDGQPVAIWF